MRCRKVRSFLSTYCKGETSPNVTAEVKNHLEDCNSCRREENVFRSMNRLVSDLPEYKTSDDFTARLFEKIGQEGFDKRKTRAYRPRRIPIFGVAKLATAASVAVIVLALGIGFNAAEKFLLPPTQPMATATPVTDVGSDDRYLTVQPTDNPLLNEHKSISRVIEQYNRWREYSRTLRVNSGAEHFLGDGQAITLASSRSGMSSNFIARPVVKNYLIVPE